MKLQQQLTSSQRSLSRWYKRIPPVGDVDQSMPVITITITTTMPVQVWATSVHVSAPATSRNSQEAP